jgi:putative ABC transport system permease protein
VVTDFKLGDREFHRPVAPVLLAEHMVQTVPEIEEAGRIMVGQFNSVVDLGEKQMQIKNATYATSEVLSIFTIPFVAGNPEGALDDPKTVVMSESMAAHLYPEEDALNKIVTFNSDDFIVKGIYKDMPENGHFKFDFIMSYAYQTSRFQMGWMNLNSYTYLKLAKTASPEAIEAKLNEALKTYVAPLTASVFNVPGAEINSGGNHARFYLQALADIHLKSNLDREIMVNGSLENVRTISLIGIVILFIAGINFVNLSTARAAIRGKEVGVRKVLGSKRKQLIAQFLFESTLYSMGAFVLACGVVVLILPYFNQIIGRQIIFTLGGTPPLWLIMFASAIILGLVAGSYPAFVLSSFNPGKTLKGQTEFKTGKSWFRSSLVVLQFSISTILIIVTLVVNNQLDFIMNKSLGFDKDKLITLDIMDLNRYDRNEEALKNELESKPNIERYSRSGFVPVSGSRREFYLEQKGEGANQTSVSVQSWPINESYIPTLGMKLKAGRNFSKALKSDTAGLILNETAARNLQLTDPVGTSLTLNTGNASYPMRVIGVVEDFHYASMKEDIKPLAFYQGRDPWSISVRFTGSPAEALSTLQTIWEEHSGGQPFVADLVSQQYRNQYQKEDQMRGIVNAFSVLAVFVAVLGLVGLATFMTEQRRKEMGIRKVLGARPVQLFSGMLRNFTIPIVISSLLAVPVAYMAANSWLSEYVYRISLSPVFFIAASLIMIVLAWLTVSFQSMKVARSNPTENLRYD